MGNITDPNAKRFLKFFNKTFNDISGDIITKYRPLTKNQLCQMQASNLCYFGSHSHRHEILTYLTGKDLRMNHLKSKDFLEKLLGRPITHFAYPNGDTNICVKRCCRESGYERGYLATAAIVKKNTDPMNIPRISVSGYDSIASLFWKINREMVRGAIMLK